MSKILALVILFNVLMDGLYVGANLAAWSAANLWALSEVATQWSIISITPVLVGAFHSLATNVQPQFNFPFWLFWVAMIGDTLFAVFILRSKKAS